jgi:CHAT domain-containing protein
MVLALRFYETFLGRDGRGETSAAEALAEAQGWLRRVRIDELIEGDYLTLSQAKEIAVSRLSNVRRRAGPAKLPRGSDARSPTPQLSHFDQIRPFANPIDWAGYTVVGR